MQFEIQYYKLSRIIASQFFINYLKLTPNYNALVFQLVTKIDEIF